MRNIEKGLVRARAKSPRLKTVDPGEEPREADVGFAPAPQPELDIERLSVMPVNRRHLSANRIVTNDAIPASSAYKMLRTRVLQRMRNNGWNTLAITGTCPEEGKSLTAINLSLALARDIGTSVVLVDFDLRKPALHTYLGLSPRYGVGDYLRGSVELEQAAVRTDVQRLGLLLNNRPYQNSSEMLSSPRAAHLVERLRQGEGRIVVFDMPPVLASDDVLAFSPYVDAVLLVLAQGKTRHADMTAARDLLENVNVLGAVLNRSSEHVAPYYYYYGH